MAWTPDLNAYFDRIGCSADRVPTLANLNALVCAHVQAVPFENLDVLLGRHIDLNPASVERKLIADRRGGYCFEQNSLLLHVLTALGYDAVPLSARVRKGRPRDFTPPRTHMALQVTLEDRPYLVDVGIGALSPTCALRLDTTDIQQTPHEPRRLAREGAWTDDGRRDPEARLFHHVRLGDEWIELCELTLEQMPAIDREVANWYTSTHPDSNFKHHLMVARGTDDGRVTLIDRTFKRRGPNGKSDKTQINSPTQLLELLDRHFGLTFPTGTEFNCPALDWSAPR